MEAEAVKSIAAEYAKGGVCDLLFAQIAGGGGGERAAPPNGRLAFLDL
jgi:hypothetical protein